MKFSHRLCFAVMTAMLSVGAWCAVPAGYYKSCEGKTGQSLLKALYETISEHTNVGYDGLWNVYKKSDVRADGTLWDIYTTKLWSANFERCGNYRVVGDCVNREHSLPKSWWGGSKSAQYSDAFHLYPTDGLVNNQRSNYPYGECASGTRLPSSGSVKALGRLGASTFSGYSGTVFEPDDEYKGDLARSYFYMVACYNSVVSGWTSGNGDKFFAGNSYPAFKTWAANLLLKWARQDKVSAKETDRNEAIYGFQHNRNPFIDYPELIEYIWGDKVGEAWYPGGDSGPKFDFPVQNATIDLGMAAKGIARSVNVKVQGSNLVSAVSLSATGEYSVSPTTLSASQVNVGTEVTITVKSSSIGDSEGSFTVKSGTLERTVDLTAQIVDGLPVNVSDVSSDGFTVNWVNLHSSAPATTYNLCILRNGENVEGFPKMVNASDESYTVSGLEAETEYVVTFSDVPGNLDIPRLSITTAAPMPFVQVLFDGELDFVTKAGVPSDVAELLLDVENIPGELNVNVTAPFEVSTDKQSWATTVKLQPEEERFYLRVNSANSGKYATTIAVEAAGMVFDDAMASATVTSASASFLEDWECVENPTETVRTYSTTVFDATACRWSVIDGGFGTAENDKNFNGTTALRMGTKNSSTIAMDEDKEGGLGVVSFDAAKWANSSEAAAAVCVEYSTDGGFSWNVAGRVTLSETAAQKYSVTVNVSGSARVRLRQESGKRWLVDNISITDYSSVGAVSELDYHRWDAYCCNSQLVIESRDCNSVIAVYSVDGGEWFNRVVTESQVQLDLPVGLYIVTDGSFARRVVVK